MKGKINKNPQFNVFNITLVSVIIMELLVSETG